MMTHYHVTGFLLTFGKNQRNIDQFSLQFLKNLWSRVYGFIVLLTRRCINQASLVLPKVKEGRSFDHVIIAE